MKLKNLFFFVFCCGLFHLNPLSAFSLGTGETYYSNHILWQKVYYMDEITTVTAAMPGSPIHGATNDWCFIYSCYNDSEYEIHLNPHLHFEAPDTLDAFISYFDSEPHTKIYPIESTIPEFIYILELHTYTEDDSELEQISRIYATQNQIYFLLVVGDDFSLANEFFDTMNIHSND